VEADTVVNMRKVICCALLLVCLPTQAEDSKHYQQWLEFKKELAVEAGGPQGFYAIQDMRELHPGESAYLSSGDADKLRWTQAAPATSLAQVQFKDGRALIRGPGIEERDLLQSKGEPLALPNGLTVRGSLLREKSLKLWLYNAKLPERKGFEALDYFPYDARGVITGTFRRNEQPVPVNYLDSREQAGIMHVVGTLQAQIGGKTYDLKTYSYSNDWKKIEGVLLLLRSHVRQDDLRRRTRSGHCYRQGIAAAGDHVRPQHRVQFPVRALGCFQLPAGAHQQRGRGAEVRREVSAGVLRRLCETVTPPRAWHARPTGSCCAGAS